MIGLPAGTRIWLAAGVTAMRAGMNGLAVKVQAALAEDPFSGHVFVFRGRRGDMLKVLWWSGDGLCLLSKRLERGRVVWPRAAYGSVALTQAQLSMDLAPRKRAARKPLPEHLPRDVQRYLPPDEACPSCGGKLHQVGEDVAEQLEFVPASFRVIRHVRPKLACGCCDPIVQSPAPSRPITRGIAGPGLLAHVLVAMPTPASTRCTKTAISTRQPAGRTHGASSTTCMPHGHRR